MGSSAQLCDDLEAWEGGLGGREAQERGDICIHITDSRCCSTETNATSEAIILQ